MCWSMMATYMCIMSQLVSAVKFTTRMNNRIPVWMPEKYNLDMLRIRPDV